MDAGSQGLRSLVLASPAKRSSGSLRLLPGLTTPRLTVTVAMPMASEAFSWFGSNLVLNGRFPHYPDHGMGYVYGRGKSELVVWADDHSIEPARGAEATETDLADFAALIDSLRRQGLRNWAEVHSRILASGWEDRGTDHYDVQSGILLQDAVTLASVADEYWAERVALLQQAGGRHPEDGSVEWPRWVTVTMRRTAAARGARALALASVEALVNELLAARHPDEYQRWEIDGEKRAFWKKLRGLLSLVGAGTEPAWFQELATHGGLRDSMLHHRPEWIRDVRDDDSVDFDVGLSQERLHETLKAVQDAVAGLFALYSVPVPDTHRPDWLARTAFKPERT